MLQFFANVRLAIWSISLHAHRHRDVWGTF